MKIRIISVLFSFLLLSLAVFSFRNHSAMELSFTKDPGTLSQDEPEKKPDYMSTFLSRDTKPLGLKEDLALKKLLRQPSIKWAIRAGRKHILD